MTIANIHKTTEPISLTKKLLILFVHEIEQISGECTMYITKFPNFLSFFERD